MTAELWLNANHVETAPVDAAPSGLQQELGRESNVLQLGFVCSPYHRGGIERWMIDMAFEWQRKHAACWFVVPRPRRPFINGVGRPAVVDLLTHGRADGLPQIVAPAAGDTYEFGTEAYRAGTYASAVRNSVPPGVPLIVSDDPAAWRAAAWSASRNPFIAVVHGEFAGYDELVRRYAPHVSAFVGVSHRVRRRVRAMLGDESAPTATIPCGIRLPDISRRPPTPGGTIRLVWIGRMQEEAKRISDLPKIAACLRDRNVSFAMDIMGDGEDRSILTEEIARLKLSDVVRIRSWGSPAEVESLLGAADVLLLPSNREGMPIAVMEALGFGCAVVASRVGGVEDYEHHELSADCLWVHAVGDVAGATTAIQRASKVEPAHRVARARALAEAEFSVARSAVRYQRLMSRLKPADSLLPNFIDRHSGLRRVISLPVATQRIVRLWSRGRYRRPQRVIVQ